MDLSRRTALDLLGRTAALIFFGRCGLDHANRPATPACDDEPTPNAIEGPFYIPNTPLRTVLREPGIAGTPLRIEGRVLSASCTPMAGAVLDFWSCDANGVYDNDGFHLRGHQFSDASGGFHLETIKPGAYTDYGTRRTPHVHVKVQGRGTRLLTTQLFFPQEPLNAGDAFIRDELIMQVTRRGDGSLLGRFDFVL